MVWDLWYSEDLEEKDCSLTQSMNDGGVCRTAPATPGLLKNMGLLSMRRNLITLKRQMLGRVLLRSK